MSKIVDFNSEKNKKMHKKEEEAKRKKHNEKVIKKIKRNDTSRNINVWKFYALLLLAIAVFIVLFK